MSAPSDKSLAISLKSPVPETNPVLPIAFYRQQSDMRYAISLYRAGVLTLATPLQRLTFAVESGMISHFGYSFSFGKRKCLTLVVAPDGLSQPEQHPLFDLNTSTN
jgi:hypothetical protein